MEQLTTLLRPGNPGAMEPWTLPAWQNWTLGHGGEPGDAAPNIADTPPTAVQVRELRPEENSGHEKTQSPTDPEGAEVVLPSLGRQAVSSGHSCPRLEDEEVEVLPEVRELGSAGVFEVGHVRHSTPLPTSPLSLSVSVGLSL
jgi:hypothetical protein